MAKLKGRAIWIPNRLDPYAPKPRKFQTKTVKRSPSKSNPMQNARNTHKITINHLTAALLILLALAIFFKL